MSISGRLKIVNRLVSPAKSTEYNLICKGGIIISAKVGSFTLTNNCPFPCLIKISLNLLPELKVAVALTDSIRLYSKVRTLKWLNFHLNNLPVGKVNIKQNAEVNAKLVTFI